MFRKVVIPAVLGDDSEGSEVAPRNGAYANALVEYEANGDLYIYASDGIYTKLEGTYTEIQKDIEKAIAEQKIYIDSEIASNILAERTAREEQDEFLHNENVALGNELNEEKNARISGDEGLDRKIDAETTARQQKDTELAQSINNETTERQSEDARINARIDAINSMEYEVVDELPATGKKGVIYLVPKTPQDPDFYKEYIWVNNRFEFIGSTDIDLVNYVKNTDYATTSTGGVVKTGAAYGTQMASSGILTSVTRTYDQYTSGNNAMFIGKATLENVLNGRKYLMPEYTQELPATGEENKLYLTPATEQPDVEATASGKDIEIADASEGDLIDWTIKGDTEQNGEPTPTTPQEVKTVTGRNTVKVNGQEVEINLGKNLFDKNNADVFKGYFTNSNTVKADEPGRTVIIPVIGGETYTWSTSDPSIMKNDSSYALLSEYPKDGNRITNRTVIHNDTSKFTITTPVEAKYIGIYCGWNTDITNVYATWQLERGSKATSYAPVENFGKNLYNRELDKIGYYLDSNGAEVVAENWHISDFIKVNAGDSYTISGITVSGAVPKSVFYNASKTPVGSFTIENKTIIIPSDTTYIKFSVFDGTGGGGATIKDSNTFQLERGSVATPYEPYFDKIELCKLGDYQDRIYKDGNEWKIEKKIAKISSYNGEAVTTSYISTTGALTIGATVYYALATPTALTIANQSLIDQLNALETLTTVKGYNLVTTDTPTIQPFLEFKYFRPDPTVTKDEWLWVENHYELLGGERRYTHNLSVNHHTAQGHWDYAFTVVGKDASHYTQLAQVAYYLFKEHAGLTIPVSGTYTEGNDIYMLTKISANSLSQVTIEMRKLSDGSSRTITTGAVPVSDTIS